jgi:Tol biopolymer transport system component
VFTRTNYNLGVGDLYLLPLSAGTKPGTLRRLTFDNRQNGQAAWTADGRNIIFTSARAGGALALWRIGLAGSRGPQRLAAVGEDSLYPAVAREGNRLIYTKYALDSNIWRVDMRHAPPSPNNTSGIPVVTSTRQDVMPRFSPDGRKIAFSSDRAGNFQVWVCDRDGTNAVQLTTFQGVNFFPSWSPDGQRIAFSSNTSGQFEIYVINAGGGRPEALTHGGEGGAWPTFSRDGKWIYFSSARSGRDEIWKVASHGGGPIQVTKTGGYMPQESADGTSLYYVRQFSTGPLYRIPVQGGEETEVIDAISARSYAVTNEGIYFILPANPKQAQEYYEVNTGNALCFLSFSTGTTNIMATLQKPLQLGVTVSPDGSSALYSQVDRLEEDLMLVENFR